MRRNLTNSIDPEDLDRSYAQMASDETREGEAAQWADALAPDIADEAR